VVVGHGGRQAAAADQQLHQRAVALGRRAEEVACTSGVGLR